MTIRIMTIGIKTHIIMTLSVSSLSMTIFNQFNSLNVTLSVVILNVVTPGETMLDGTNCPRKN
jgi:hypothetical protein